MFSFGVILWELMTERVPWRDLDSLQVKSQSQISLSLFICVPAYANLGFFCLFFSFLFFKVVAVVGFMDRRLDLPEGLDPRVASIICDCWESDPERRPSFQEIVGRMAELTGAVASAPAHRSSERSTGGAPPGC